MRSNLNLALDSHRICKSILELKNRSVREACENFIVHKINRSWCGCDYVIKNLCQVLLEIEHMHLDSFVRTSRYDQFFCLVIRMRYTINARDHLSMSAFISFPRRSPVV